MSIQRRRGVSAHFFIAVRFCVVSVLHCYVTRATSQACRRRAQGELVGETVVRVKSIDVLSREEFTFSPLYVYGVLLWCQNECCCDCDVTRHNLYTCRSRKIFILSSFEINEISNWMQWLPAGQSWRYQVLRGLIFCLHPLTPNPLRQTCTQTTKNSAVCFIVSDNLFSGSFQYQQKGFEKHVKIWSLFARLARFLAPIALFKENRRTVQIKSAMSNSVP